MLESPAGQGEALFRLPDLPKEWLGVRTGLIRSTRHLRVDEPADAASPREIGEALFQALFAGQVRTLLAQSRGAVEPRGRGLRLRLRFRLDPADPRLTLLHGLPWELLYQADTRDFLGLSRRSPVVRALDVPRPTPPLPLVSPLRILAVLATARDLAPLDLERERKLLRKAWAGRRGAEITFQEGGGIAELRKALLAREIHVLHFMGHGEIDPATGAGILLFAGPDGAPQPVTGEALATTVKDFEPLRLVFLNACETGRTPGGDADPFTSVATALVLGGVPAVVAMQLPIEDEAAIAFSQTVYERLAAGDPIDAAVTEGRHAIHARHPDTAEWAIPVLFTRIPDGRIFERSTAVPWWKRFPALPAVRLPKRWLTGGAVLCGLAALGFLAVRLLDRPLMPDRIRLDGFWIARYETSHQEFQRFVRKERQWRRGRIDPAFHDGDYLKGWISPTVYPDGLDDHPVTHVSWYAARAFCEWTGGRLPTQEEWQVAAHSAESLYPWIKMDLSGPPLLNFCDERCDRPHRNATPGRPNLRDGYSETAPVNAFPAGQTREGVYNLSGNVWEWCFTLSGKERVTMGGSYLTTFEECTTDIPGFEDARTCAPDGGFRCIWD